MKTQKIDISHPDKVLFPDAGITKQAIATYFEKIADTLLPYIRERPLTFKRFTEGIEETGFFNKHAPDYFPDHIARLEVPMRSQPGKTMRMALADEAADLIYLAGQDVIEIHVGLATAQHLEKPDQMVFDFDPSDGDFGKVRKAALELKVLLDEKNLPAFVKTTGSRGVHVHIPIKPSQPFEVVKETARQFAQALHQRCPQLTTLEVSKEKRGNRVFIDYLRNDYGMTAIAPYSLRALKGAPIATPIDWQELKKRNLDAQSYHLNNIFRRLAQKEDPWKQFNQHRIELPF